MAAGARLGPWTEKWWPPGVSVIRVQAQAGSEIVPVWPLVERTDAAPNRVGANLASGSVWH